MAEIKVEMDGPALRVLEKVLGAGGHNGKASHEQLRKGTIALGKITQEPQLTLISTDYLRITTQQRHFQGQGTCFGSGSIPLPLPRSRIRCCI